MAQAGRTIKACALDCFCRWGLWALWLWAGFPLWAKEITTNPLRTKLERYLPYNIDEIEASANSIDFNPRQVAEDLGQKLNQFYFADPSEKKIASRQDNDSTAAWFRREWNVNLQRLFMRDLLARPQPGFLIKEAPNIALLHYNYALAQKKLKKPYHAAYHFAQSLRYRSLRFDDTIYTDRDRLQLVKAGSQEIADAENYRKLKEALQQKEREKLRLEEELIVLDDQARSPKPAELVEAERQRQKQLLAEREQQLRQSLARVRGEYEQLKKEFAQAEERFVEYAKAYNRRSADMLVEMAELVRQIEDAIKERSKVLNKKVLYKTSFNQTLQHDYSQNRQFTAYANILEAASRLDPENPRTSFLLAEEYRTSQEVSRSIDAYERALKANEKPRENFALSEEQVRRAHAALGALYYAKNRFVDAAYFYEKAYNSTNDAREKQNLGWQLAKLHVEKTGNYARARQLLESYLEQIAALNPTDVADRTQWIKERFTANRYLTHIYEKANEPQKVAAALRQAASAHEDLEALIATLRERNNKTYQELQNAKQNLLEEVRSRDLNVFLRLEAEYEKQKRELALIETGRNSLPLAEFYATYARFLESQHDIAGALRVYAAAEKFGLGADHARREQGRLRAQYPGY
ncbi:MAG: hypothetical protein N2Z22_02465 [Turneriella sp.]|nr:hypothetical protein [Turneriella sp.]